MLTGLITPIEGVVTVFSHVLVFTNGLNDKVAALRLSKERLF
jgi:hypothetical protein